MREDNPSPLKCGGKDSKVEDFEMMAEPQIAAKLRRRDINPDALKRMLFAGGNPDVAGSDQLTQREFVRVLAGDDEELREWAQAKAEECNLPTESDVPDHGVDAIHTDNEERETAPFDVRVAHGQTADGQPVVASRTDMATALGNTGQANEVDDQTEESGTQTPGTKMTGGLQVSEKEIAGDTDPSGTYARKDRGQHQTIRSTPLDVPTDALNVDAQRKLSEMAIDEIRTVGDALAILDGFTIEDAMGTDSQALVRTLTENLTEESVQGVSTVSGYEQRVPGAKALADSAEQLQSEREERRAATEESREQFSEQRAEAVQSAQRTIEQWNDRLSEHEIPAQLATNPRAVEALDEALTNNPADADRAATFAEHAIQTSDSVAEHHLSKWQVLGRAERRVQDGLNRKKAIQKVADDHDPEKNTGYVSAAMSAADPQDFEKVSKDRLDVSIGAPDDQPYGGYVKAAPYGIDAVARRDWDTREGESLSCSLSSDEHSHALKLGMTIPADVTAADRSALEDRLYLETVKTVLDMGEDGDERRSLTPEEYAAALDSGFLTDGINQVLDMVPSDNRGVGNRRKALFTDTMDLDDTDLCPDCRGAGESAPEHGSTCSTCDGTGEVPAADSRSSAQKRLELEAFACMFDDDVMTVVTDDEVTDIDSGNELIFSPHRGKILDDYGYKPVGKPDYHNVRAGVARLTSSPMDNDNAQYRAVVVDIPEFVTERLGFDDGECPVCGDSFDVGDYEGMWQHAWDTHWMRQFDVRVEEGNHHPHEPHDPGSTLPVEFDAFGVADAEDSDDFRSLATDEIRSQTDVSFCDAPGDEPRITDPGVTTFTVFKDSLHEYTETMDALAQDEDDFFRTVTDRPSVPHLGVVPGTLVDIDAASESLYRLSGGEYLTTFAVARGDESSEFTASGHETLGREPTSVELLN